MIQLREYQTDLIEGIRTEIKNGNNRILTVSPTGSGKTIMFTYIAKNAKIKSQLP